MATYSKSSPYYATGQFGVFLDVLNFREIPKLPSDVEFSINSVYEFRPDLLAYDLYGDQSLWWVFAVRNPNVIQDPVFDFVAPTIIYVPSKQVIQRSIGL